MAEFYLSCEKITAIGSSRVSVFSSPKPGAIGRCLEANHGCRGCDGVVEIVNFWGPPNAPRNFPVGIIRPFAVVKLP